MYVRLHLLGDATAARLSPPAQLTEGGSRVGARVLKKEGVCSDMASYFTCYTCLINNKPRKLRIHLNACFQSIPEPSRTFTGLRSYRYFGYHCHLRIRALQLTLRPLSLGIKPVTWDHARVLGNGNGHDGVCHQTLGVFPSKLALGGRI